MENIKAKFFALYLGQKVQYPNLEGKLIANKLTGISYDYISLDYTRKRNGCSGEDLSFKSNGHHNSDALHACLLLRTIDQLTDEELTNVIKLSKLLHAGHYEPSLNDVAMGKWIVSNNEFIHDTIGQYLRSIGILLPFTYLDNHTHTTLSVDDILGMGWVVIEGR